jgi:hypothetical protein
VTPQQGFTLRENRMPRPRNYHSAPAFRLDEWAKDGDLLAEFERAHHTTIRQMVDDFRATPPTSLGPESYGFHLSETLRLHFRKEGGMVVLSIRLDGRIPKQVMIDHWDEIEAWRVRLQRWQGLRTQEAHLLNKMAAWNAPPHRHINRELVNSRKAYEYKPVKQVNPRSYQALASGRNADIAGSLNDFAQNLWLERHRGRTVNLDALFDVPSWRFPSQHWTSPLKYAVWIMEVMGLSREAIGQWCRSALNNLSHGRPAFDTDQPLDRDRIINKLKRWRRRSPESPL